MMYNKKILTTLSKKYDKDIRVIDAITRSSFRFLYDVTTNPIDFRPVRYMYLGVFSQKKSNNKLNRITADPVKHSRVLLGCKGL